MKTKIITPLATNSVSGALARPRPTAASALLLAVLLSLPFAILAMMQAVF